MENMNLFSEVDGCSRLACYDRIFELGEQKGKLETYQIFARKADYGNSIEYIKNISRRLDDVDKELNAIKKYLSCKLPVSLFCRDGNLGIRFISINIEFSNHFGSPKSGQVFYEFLNYLNKDHTLLFNIIYYEEEAFVSLYLSYLERHGIIVDIEKAIISSIMIELNKISNSQ